MGFPYLRLQKSLEALHTAYKGEKLLEFRYLEFGAYGESFLTGRSRVEFLGDAIVKSGESLGFFRLDHSNAGDVWLQLAAAVSGISSHGCF